MLWLTEVRVIHSFTCSQASLVVVTQQLVQEVQSLSAHEVLVLTMHKALPSLTRMPAHKHTALMNGPYKVCKTTIMLFFF